MSYFLGVFIYIFCGILWNHFYWQLHMKQALSEKKSAGHKKTAARGTEPKKKAQTLITMTSGTEPMTPTKLLNRIKDF